MHRLSASQLLEVWERGRSLSPTQRALALLRAATPGADVDELARVSIGRRDRRLLQLREATFGSDVRARADCPSCGQRLELEFEVADIVVPVASPTEDNGALPTSLPAGHDTGPHDWLPFVSEGYDLRFRLPNSADLEWLADEGGTEPDPERGLFERCVARVALAGEEIAVEHLPDPVVREVIDRMAREDPQADLSLALSCPSCEHTWQLPFDIVEFFWKEIDSWAKGTLRDVDTLARTYGWTEAEVLALSPSRRRYYTELARA